MEIWDKQSAPAKDGRTMESVGRGQDGRYRASRVWMREVDGLVCSNSNDSDGSLSSSQWAIMERGWVYGGT